MLVRTGHCMYHFEVSRTALYPRRYVPARSSTYHLVLPCTRGTGFQMICAFLLAKLEEHSSGGHLELCQNPISGHDVPISVYSDIEPDIGYDIADTRYRVCPDSDIGYPDIGTYLSDIRYVPISDIPDIGTNIGIYLYRDQTSRYRVSQFPDIAHDVSCSQQAPGPGLGLAFQLLQPARNC
jgi:hypothetical protein